MSSGSLRSMGADGDADADACPTSGNPKVRALEELVAGPLPSSTSRLSASSRLIPSAKDFHFFNNFPDYRREAGDIASISVSSLNAISSSALLWGSNCPPGFPVDLDDAYDWLVNLNDECLERVGVSMDEFKNLREKQEENGVRSGLEDGEGGFQLVYRKKKKGSGGVRGDCGFERDKGFVAAAGVKVASRDKKTMSLRPKVPFHIPTIPRPQTEFNIIANNSNQPFEHVWLERSADGSRLIHPLGKLSVVDFVDRNVGEGDPTKPSALESTPFKFVEGVKELKELSAKLQYANEFAVDLEHNQYRSYQGLTCLMQISTRDEDFIVDTLKLRIHIGPYLREVFKDPLKKKVMHGADRDILWLQRDFGIYVCNLFDTGQASRVLQLERNSLEYLLHNFCEVSANKEYQNADWRLRPLPYEMLKYAREDTHYLLHIYDLMRSRLIDASTSEMDLLTEVYRRSSEICMQLYEKELFTETSYLYIYGLHEAGFDSKQLAVVAALCEWRDSVARAEDESTGYVLPNKALLEIARQMPVSASKLRRLARSKHHYVERCLNSVVNIIRRAIENSAAFEGPCEQLKKARQEEFPGRALDGVDNSVAMPAEDLVDSTTNHAVLGANYDTDMLSGEVEAAGSMSVENDKMNEIFQSIPSSDAGCSFRTFSHPEKALTSDLEKSDDQRTEGLISARTAAVQVSKKPTHAFGALFGSMSSRSKVNLLGGSSTERDKNESKVEQIKSSLVLPFHSFYNLKPSKQSGPVKSSQSTPENAQQNVSQLSGTSKMEEVTPLDNGTKNFQSSTESPCSEDGHLKHRDWFPLVPENDNSVDNQPEMMLEAPMSLSDLSTSFQECFKSVNQMKGSQQSCKPSQESRINFQFKPFDYAAARSNMKFGEDQEVAAKGDHRRILGDTGGTRKGSELACVHGEGELREFQQPRRRQAFPPSGNRSATYR